MGLSSYECIEFCHTFVTQKRDKSLVIWAEFCCQPSTWVSGVLLYPLRLISRTLLRQYGKNLKRVEILPRLIQNRFAHSPFRVAVMCWSHSKDLKFTSCQPNADPGRFYDIEDALAPCQIKYLFGKYTWSRFVPQSSNTANGSDVDWRYVWTRLFQLTQV